MLYFWMILRLSQWLRSVHWGSDSGSYECYQLQGYIVPCSPFINPRFGEMYHLALQRWKSAEQDSSVQQVAEHCPAGFWPWRWRWYMHLKCWITHGLHGVTSQKVAFSTRLCIARDGATAVRPSNHTKQFLVMWKMVMPVILIEILYSRRTVCWCFPPPPHPSPLSLCIEASWRL
jgi:hypothetical protein